MNAIAKRNANDERYQIINSKQSIKFISVLEMNQYCLVQDEGIRKRISVHDHHMLYYSQ